MQVAFVFVSNRISMVSIIFRSHCSILRTQATFPHTRENWTTQKGGKGGKNFRKFGTLEKAKLISRRGTRAILVRQHRITFVWITIKQFSQLLSIHGCICRRVYCKWLHVCMCEEMVICESSPTYIHISHRP